ncbi:uncharacterized protein LOC133846851 isoform X2 [Drosophila sulfurigaster albostrigata]|uniref:uncharacterized protein LOC133846851 isoform X2 n=1 Tax=Drosophila sulfurigaster albostrigata TaxID=89887 RepID=UPI002D21C881|nr:uncharacterized protein LOC133846851 isoform X2 [Drosophila sulfurigaster albostrigata]
MGTKVTKMDGSYLPDTPTLNKLRIANTSAPNQEIEMLNTTPGRGENKELLDPRSPNGCRTPLNTEPQIKHVENLPVVNENAFAQLRKRLLKGFALNDPRSPQLNRTPLILDEAIDRTLNMDDTFSDLFVETRVPTTTIEVETVEQQHAKVSEGPSVHNNSSLEIVSLPYDEEDTMPCDIVLQHTPPQLGFDPRSPSVGVERTPIIFCDDEESEERETQMLEEILETLTLNLSNESSMASFVSAAEIALDEPQQQTEKPANKHLERVRLGNKRRVAPRKPARASKSQIYVDSSSSTPKSTPKSTSKGTPNGTQRTPLCCINKNRVHLRSRSVDKDTRIKTQLPLQCYDDQLNPSERVLRILNMEG